MASADLRRLIQRATPRVEDVRSPDRTDIIRREHGHLPFREVITALDALEFSVDTFLEQMQAILGSDVDTTGAVETAVHGLLRAVEGIQVLGVATAVPLELPHFLQASTEAGANWQEAASASKAKGAEHFRKKEFKEALEEYSAAIAATPDGHPDLAALRSNRSAALLQLGELPAALAEARRCVELSPEWPKGYFREGCCCRQLGRLPEALVAFGKGRELEPGNGDWQKEVEKTERLHRSQPSTLVWQLLFQLLPDLLAAWVRGGDPEGVLQLQVNGELSELGLPKWQLLRDGRPAAKAQIRFAFLSRKGYLANLAANMQSPPAEGVAVADLQGQSLKIPEVVAFLGSNSGALVHLDVRNNAGAGRMAAVLCSLPTDSEVLRFVPLLKDPAPPRGPVDGVVEVQRRSGFPKTLPRLIGFQSYPGDLNFPVIDLSRDAPALAASND